MRHWSADWSCDNDVTRCEGLTNRLRRTTEVHGNIHGKRPDLPNTVKDFNDVS
jgi:hypothetical protein